MNADESDREKVFDEFPRSKFLWRVHCERTYERGKWRDINGLPMVPGLNCDGDPVIQAWDWQALCDHHREYPETPEFGKVYPLHGSSPTSSLQACSAASASTHAPTNLVPMPSHFAKSSRSVKQPADRLGRDYRL